MISGHSIFTGFRELTGCQRDLRDRGITAWYQSLSTRIPRTRWGMGLGYALLCVACFMLNMLCDMCE